MCVSKKSNGFFLGQCCMFLPSHRPVVFSVKDNLTNLKNRILVKVNLPTGTSKAHFLCIKMFIKSGIDPHLTPCTKAQRVFPKMSNYSLKCSSYPIHHLLVWFDPRKNNPSFVTKKRIKEPLKYGM